MNSEDFFDIDTTLLSIKPKFDRLDFSLKIAY